MKTKKIKTLRDERPTKTASKMRSISCAHLVLNPYLLTRPRCRNEKKKIEMTVGRTRMSKDISHPKAISTVGTMRAKS